MSVPKSAGPTWLVVLAVALAGVGGSLQLTLDAAAQQRPDCANFLDQPDAQVVLDADPSDPFNLDRDGNGIPCEEPAEPFGTTPLANCDDLNDYPGIAQALYDASVAKYGSDRYELAACVQPADANQTPPTEDAPGGGGGNDQEPLDGTPLEISEPGTRRTDRPERAADEPVTGDGGITVRTGGLGMGAALEDRLEARFAALEAEFAQFEARAENGFGRFPESGDDRTSEDAGSSTTVTTAQKPVATTERTPAPTLDQTSLSQTVRVTKGEGPRLGAGHRLKQEAHRGDKKEGKQRRGHRQNKLRNQP